MKIDTEGNDLRVLRGARDLLVHKKIDFIVVETGFYPKDRHIELSAFLKLLTPLGYFLLGIYDQALEWNKDARVQYANALFARGGIKIDY